MPVSRTQIDKLGERLKAGVPTEEDLRELDEYRRSFGHAYDVVVSALRDHLGLQVSGRSAKTTAAILNRLSRESARVIQKDIAGCRVVVGDVKRQESAVAAIRALFEETRSLTGALARAMGIVLSTSSSEPRGDR
jgi:hypothetical protein